MKYYGHVSFDMKLTFVTETVAYDVSAICEIANELGRHEEDEMLQSSSSSIARSSSAARRKGSSACARRRSSSRLLPAHGSGSQGAHASATTWKASRASGCCAIRQQLESVTSKDFWEIIDRGRNFEFMPPEQRECMKTFFSWLAIDSAVSSKNRLRPHLRNSPRRRTTAEFDASPRREWMSPFWLVLSKQRFPRLLGVCYARERDGCRSVTFAAKVAFTIGGGCACARISASWSSSATATRGPRA